MTEPISYDPPGPKLENQCIRPGGPHDPSPGVPGAQSELTWAMLGASPGAQETRGDVGSATGANAAAWDTGRPGFLKIWALGACRARVVRTTWLGPLLKSTSVILS